VHGGRRKMGQALGFDRGLRLLKGIAWVAIKCIMNKGRCVGNTAM